MAVHCGTRTSIWRAVLGGVCAAGAALLTTVAAAETPPTLEGAAAFGDWRKDAPGVQRKFGAGDLPQPFATKPAAHSPRVAEPPADFLPKVPPGFTVSRFTSGLQGPRAMIVAPNGDVIVAETRAGRISVLRPTEDGRGVAAMSAFAAKLDGPFGMAFYPSGADPQWLYVANTGSVVRFAYRNGDTKARGAPETIVKSLPDGGHSTRGLAFSRDGKTMLVSVGSASNVAEGLEAMSSEAAHNRDQKVGIVGSAWGYEQRRAAVLAFAPDGGGEHVFASGLRNCVTVAVHPGTGDAWCTVNERDGLGDDLVPDYVTRVGKGNFFGWPWYYIGGHEDPRQRGRRPDLANEIRVPDVLLQSHSAALGLTFYDGTQFPPEYVGNGFVALHGSWNRSIPTGYKVVRLVMERGVPSGVYEDFMTGLVAADDKVWGRPVGVAVARDGSLLVSDDGNGIVWRVSHGGK